MKPDRDTILRALFERHDGPVFVLDSAFHYVEFNEAHRAAMASLYGAVPKVGENLLDQIPDEASRTFARNNLARALAGETVVEVTPYDFASPPPECFRVSHIPIVGNDGLIVGVLVTAQNLTREMQAKRRLSVSEHTMQEALDASEIASWSYRGDTGETHFSDRYYTMLGYSPGEFPQALESWTSLLHPDDASAALGSFRYYIQTQTESFQMEFRLRTKSGGWKWILGRAKVIDRNAQGLPIRVVGTNQDITPRKLAQEALRESESRWTSLVDMAPVGISLIGAAGIVQFVNRKESLFKNDTAIGRNWKDFMPEAMHSELARVLEAGFVRGESLKFRSWSSEGANGVSYYDNHVSPVLEDGGVSALLVVSIDVTASEVMAHRRRKAARRAEMLLSLHNDTQGSRQSLLDAALGAAVELTDSGFGYVYLYSEETELFTLHSWSREVMEACRVKVPQATNSLALTGYWGEVVRQRRPILVNEFHLLTDFHRGLPAGHVPLSRFLTIPVIEAGKIVAVVGVGNKVLPYDDDDVIELNLLADSFWQLLRRRESEEALHRLYQAVEHAPVSVLITDQAGTICYANPRFFEVSDSSFADALAAGPAILESGLMDAAGHDALWATLLAGQDWQGELVSKKKDGTLFTELASISPVLDPSGEITHFIAVKEDITERKATQNLLMQTQKMETVGQLAAGVAHDFNNLLTSMLGYNQMLLLKLEPQNPLRIYAEKLELSGQRAASLVSGLLAVGRRQRMEPQVIDLAVLIGEELVLLESLVKGRVTLKWLEAPGPLLVEVDPGQIGQVVINLVSNANDALAPGGTITLSSGRDDTRGPRVWFRVADNGPGIPQDIREKIFDPFFTTKGIGQGTGLGLSIVQGVIHQHHGTIELEPGSGGASFLVSLPRFEVPTTSNPVNGPSSFRASS